MDVRGLTGELKRRAAELGFSLCGVCPAVAPPGAARLDEWLAAGYAGQMHYLADRREAYARSEPRARRRAKHRHAGDELPHGRAG